MTPIGMMVYQCGYEAGASSSLGPGKVITSWGTHENLSYDAFRELWHSATDNDPPTVLLLLPPRPRAILAAVYIELYDLRVRDDIWCRRAHYRLCNPHDYDIEADVRIGGYDGNIKFGLIINPDRRNADAYVAVMPNKWKYNVMRANLEMDVLLFGIGRVDCYLSITVSAVESGVLPYATP